MTRARALASRLVWLVAVCAWNVAAGQVVRAPRVSGPIAVTAPPGDPSHNYPFASTRHWLEPFDYQEDEFYVEGDAVVYVADGVNTSTVAPGGPYAFKTRVVVHRPRNAARFNGTVILEWITVSAGQDQENAWIWAHEHLMRSGYAHVGVSAQQLGVAALKTWNSARYGSLDVDAGGRFTDLIGPVVPATGRVPFDLSYDIFSQVAYALKHPAAPQLLGDLGSGTSLPPGTRVQPLALALTTTRCSLSSALPSSTDLFFSGAGSTCAPMYGRRGGRCSLKRISPARPRTAKKTVEQSACGKLRARRTEAGT